MKRPLTFIAIALLALSVSGVAGAVDSEGMFGLTWYANGTYAQSGPSGLTITAWASGARANTVFHLIVAPAGGFENRCEQGRQEVNPAARRSSRVGFIPYTTGHVTGPPGEYDVCFLSDPIGGPGLRLATLPASLTII